MGRAAASAGVVFSRQGDLVLGRPLAALGYVVARCAASPVDPAGVEASQSQTVRHWRGVSFTLLWEPSSFRISGLAALPIDRGGLLPKAFRPSAICP